MFLLQVRPHEDTWTLLALSPYRTQHFLAYLLQYPLLVFQYLLVVRICLPFHNCDRIRAIIRPVNQRRPRRGITIHQPSSSLPREGISSVRVSSHSATFHILLIYHNRGMPPVPLLLPATDVPFPSLLEGSVSTFSHSPAGRIATRHFTFSRNSSLSLRAIASPIRFSSQYVSWPRDLLSGFSQLLWSVVVFDPRISPYTV